MAALLLLLKSIPSAITGLNWSAILPVLAKYWYLLVIGVLLLTNAFTYREWQDTKFSLTLEKSVHAQDILNFKNAVAISNAKAKAEKAILQKESKSDATRADANYSVLLARYHDSLLRYATHQSEQPTGGGYSPTAPSGNGPGTSSIIPKTLTISLDDGNICAINTARLQAVHDWAIDLPKEVTP